LDIELISKEFNTAGARSEMRINSHFSRLALADKKTHTSS